MVAFKDVWRYGTSSSDSNNNRNTIYRLQIYRLQYTKHLNLLLLLVSVFTIKVFNPGVNRGGGSGQRCFIACKLDWLIARSRLGTTYASNRDTWFHLKGF